MMHLTPKQIVDELNRHIVGQENAKKSVALALRNRWRRQQVKDETLRQEIVPKNILMIGPTGVGKTEIARRLAKLANAPFAKVEATKFTEVGYVGRDVEQIIRDLVEFAINDQRSQLMEQVKEQAEQMAEERLLKALVGARASEETREKFRAKLRNGSLEEKEIDIEVVDAPDNPLAQFDVPGGQMQMGMMNIGDLLGKSFTQYKTRRLKISEARKIVMNEEADKLIDEDTIRERALKAVEDNGIVFLDEVDKICGRTSKGGPDVSREGVQRDLLPLLEGTTVTTKHGPVKTDHILFIASGAFHVAKPSELLPELQGRLPIRVELSSLKQEDFVRILKEPEASLLTQYKALLEAEGVTLTFADEGITRLAEIAFEVNKNVENIGARRLHTIMEKLLEELSFAADDNEGQTFEISKEYVDQRLKDLVKNVDLSKFIL